MSVVLSFDTQTKLLVLLRVLAAIISKGQNLLFKEKVNTKILGFVKGVK